MTLRILRSSKSINFDAPQAIAFLDTILASRWRIYSPKDLVIGVDASTTAVKVIVWDEEGRAMAEGRQAIEPGNLIQPGTSSPADDWWQAFCVASRAALED
jgi:hypothetical protein